MKEFNKHLSKWKEYDLVVINDNLHKCYRDIMDVIKKNKKKNLYNFQLIKNHVKSLSV